MSWVGIALRGHYLEYHDETHTYLVDGVILPSVTQILSKRFGKRYEGVNKAVLNKAAEYGTKVHAEIEAYCRSGELGETPEARNFRFLQGRYGLHVIANELPVILFKEDKPIAAGRLDLVLMQDGKLGGADIKCTSSLDKEYVGRQLNIYRIAYAQSYGKEWEFLKAIHLKGDTRRLVDIPINEKLTWGLINDYFAERSKNEQSDFDWQDDERA